jgi:hypothetical protein
MLSSIDNDLQKRGANTNELPPPPPAAETFKNGVAQAIVAKASGVDQAATQVTQRSQDVQTSGILSAIDQKLQAKGVEPSKFEAPPTTEQLKEREIKNARPQSVALEPKLAVEKGPLFLNPGEIEQQAPVAAQEVKNQDNSQPTAETASQEPPSRLLVKGPIQPRPAAASRVADAKRPSSTNPDDDKGVFEQLRDDLDNVSKALNPFRW